MVHSLGSHLTLLITHYCFFWFFNAKNPFFEILARADLFKKYQKFKKMNNRIDVIQNMKEHEINESPVQDDFVLYRGHIFRAPIQDGVWLQLLRTFFLKYLVVELNPHSSVSVQLFS